jgi:hypothetical protein
MAIDAIVGILELFDPLGHFALQGDNILTGKREKWKNSKYDIVFGDSTNFIIGLGRQTIVAGPDIKSILDWTVLFDWLGEKIENKAGKFLYDFTFGQGGSTDFILGNKNLFNYGTADFSVTRKAKSATEVKLKHDDDKFGNEITDSFMWLRPTAWQKILVTLYAVFQFGSAVAIRLLYMGLGINVDNKGETEKRKKLVEILILVQSLSGIRILALLGKVETLYFTADMLKIRNTEAKSEATRLAGNLRLSLERKKAALTRVNNLENRAAQKQDDNDLNFDVARQVQNNADEIEFVGKNAVGDAGFAVFGHRGPDATEQEISNVAKTFVNQDSFRYYTKNGYTFITNPRIYGGAKDPNGDGGNKISDTEFNQNQVGFDFRAYHGDEKNPLLNQLRFAKEGFSLNNEDPKFIYFRNGIGDSPSRSGLALAMGEVCLDCGEYSGGPSLDMNAKENTLSFSQSLRPRANKGQLGEVNGPTVFLGNNHGGIYGGKKSDDNKTAGYIELKGDKSLVIKLLGNEIKMDANGISLSSKNPINISSDAGIHLGCEKSVLSVLNNGIFSMAGENTFKVLFDKIEEKAVALELSIQSVLKKVLVLEGSNIEAVEQADKGVSIVNSK